VKQRFCHIIGSKARCPASLQTAISLMAIDEISRLLIGSNPHAWFSQFEMPPLSVSKENS
jgi:hypothetical protein